MSKNSDKDKSDNVTQAEATDSDSQEKEVLAPNLELRYEAQKVVDQYSKYSFLSGFIPFVALDLVAVVAAQVKMIGKISEVYGYKLSDVGVKAGISSFLGATVPQTLSAGGSSAVKSIPVVGTIAGMALSPSLYALSTQAVGSTFVKHFEGGGDLLKIDFKKMSEQTSNYVKSKGKSGDSEKKVA